MNRENIIDILQLILTTIRGLNDEQYHMLLSGKAKLKFVALDTPNITLRQKTTRKGPIPILTENDIKKVIDVLNVCKTREEAYMLFRENSIYQLKDNLLAVAQSFDIHVTKSDKNDDIVNKIIDNTVGTRLNSEAILNLNLKGG